jgi:hypothetical protein
VKEKVFAYSIQAGRYVFGLDHEAGFCRSTSIVKAKERAMEAALERWPVEKEWRFHSVKVKVVREGD